MTPAQIKGLRRLLWACDATRMHSKSGPRGGFWIPVDRYAEQRDALDTLLGFDGTGHIKDKIDALLLGCVPDAPHSPEEAARLLLGLGPDDEEVETLDRVRELKTRARGFDLVTEIAARLTRDAEHQRRERHVSIGEARIRADALALHLGGFARIVADAQALAAAGDLGAAVVLLRKEDR